MCHLINILKVTNYLFIIPNTYVATGSVHTPKPL